MYALSKEDIEHVKKMKNVLHEELFLIVYTTSVTWEEAYSMSVSKRRWLINRISTQKTAEANAVKSPNQSR